MLEAPLERGARPAAPAERKHHALRALLEQQRRPPYRAKRTSGTPSHPAVCSTAVFPVAWKTPVSANRHAPMSSSRPNSGLPVTDTTDMTSISAVSVSRNTASGRLCAPGGPCSRLMAVAAHAALSVVRPVAAPLSLARKANRPLSASSGTTNASTRVATCAVSVTGTQRSSSAVSSMVRPVGPRLPVRPAINPRPDMFAIGAAGSGSGMARADVREQSARELAIHLGEQLTRLVRQELALARAELFANARQAVLGGGMLSAAAVVGLGAWLAAVAAAIAGIAEGLPVWASALIVAVALGALAGGLALLGRSRLARGAPPLSMTAASVRHELAELTGRNGSNGRNGQP
jgi:Putative Actinobacterial Holin-X, holin superfamily III